MRKEDEMQEGRLSGAMRIFEALSSVDEELLVRSDGQKNVVPFWKYAKVMAACICFVVVGVAAYTGIDMKSAKENASADCAAPAAMEAAAEEAAPEDEKAAVADDSGYNEEVAEEPAEAAEEEVAVGEETVVSGGAVKEETVTDGALQEAVAEESPAEAEVSQHSAESGSVGDGAEMDSRQESILDYGKEVPPVQDEETLRETEVLGAYIPTKLPVGYVFESGYGIDEKNPENGISLLWVNGMDTISISVREYVADAETERRIVDVSDTASYDVHLYEIPYCDSVPEKYYKTFHNPIFEEGDFTFEIVEARMKSVSEQGDTDTPRGNFAVLYESGILLEFNGRGDAESIWEMLESIER